MATTPRFTTKTVPFLLKASRARRLDWLDKNREDYETAILHPLQHLAQELKTKLGGSAPFYHFPLKGIGRLKRPANRVAENGGGPFKSWLSYSAARPRESRFEHNPNLYFMIDPWDKDDTVLVAGGLYMPSSRQVRAIREAIANDASAFDRLFKTREFSKCFKGGFSRDRTATRPPRGFDPNHPRIDWLKLQAFFVWRSYKRREFLSPKFPDLVARDWKQILRLNELLDQAIAGRLPKAEPKRSSLMDRLEEIKAPRPMLSFD